MNSPSKDTEEPSSSTVPAVEGTSGSGNGPAAQPPRPPAKRPASSAVIEISDTESDDSDVCAVNSYQASADEVKRIRGADYSTSSSSSDYSSDSESPWEDDSILLEDLKADIKAVKAPLNPRANRMDDPLFNPKIKSQELIDRLTTHWKEQKDLTTASVTLTSEPFRVCQLHDFLANPEMINNIVDDMNTLDWSRKKMDLYEFHQTMDLASLTWQRSIRGIYDLLKTEVMSWVSQVTGLELRSVSASCSLYGPGDHLLVHDDLLADRRVAFILYLAPWRQPRRHQTRQRPIENGDPDKHDVVEVEDEWCGWARAMGGALQLVARDERGQPTRVTRSIYPRNNMLAFFKVGADSFHQVEEVLSLELPRLSINGWFHGPATDSPAGSPADLPADLPAELPADSPGDLPASSPAAPDSPPEVSVRPHTDIVLLNQWIEATYMSPRSRLQVQAQMERESEVCLQRLLQPDKCEQLLAALADPEIPWERCGPANRRHYSVLPGEWVQAQPAACPLRGLLSLASSAAFLRMLADCTDLALATYDHLELQRWAAGDYTLLPPRSRYQAARLEAVLYLGVPERTLCGGITTYVAPEEAAGEPGGGGGGGEAGLVALPPTHNALALVYCDPGVAAFTKYLSRLSVRPAEHFYILVCTYRE